MKLKLKRLRNWMGAALAMAACLLGTVDAEGSVQTSLGSTDATQPFNQFLFSYDETNAFVKTTNRPIYVDVRSSGEVINISLCGTVDADPLRIEIYNPSGGLVETFVPITGNGKISCSDTLAGPITTAHKYTTTTTGTYQIRLFNTSANEKHFKRYDITVTPSTATNPDPRINGGRVWAYAWAFNGNNSFAAVGATDADYFVRVPGGRSGTEYIWKLDLNRFAGQRYEIIANSIGLNAPNSGYSTDGTSTATPLHPIYLSYPAQASSPPTVAPVISNFRFEGAAGRTFISPGTTVGVNDSGNFKFTGDVDGTYTITIDTNKDGVYGAGDRLLLGTSTASVETSVVWDGKDAAGNVLAIGNYNAELKVRLGEYHFVAYDVETSGGGTSNGLTVYRATSQTGTSNTQVYWDDLTKLPSQGGTSNLPAGGTSGTAAGAHTWGNFAAGSLGDTRYLDTYVYGLASSVLSSAAITNGDASITGKVYNDVNKNGVADSGETGITSATVQLLDSSQVVIMTVQADSSGNYAFLGVAAGTYTVKVVSDSAVAGKTPTTPAPAQKTVTVTSTAVANNDFGFVASADLAVTKTDGVTSVISGSATTYTIRVTNNGPSSITGAVLKDPAATGLTQTAAACTAINGNTCTTAPTTAALQGAGVTLPALASGVFYEFTATATVTAASGNVTNTATVDVPSDVTDLTPGNNTASDVDTVTPLPKLTVTKISTGGVGTFGFTGNNGFTDSITTVTAGTGVAGTTKTLAAAGAATTVTETGPAGFQMTNVSCTGLGSGTVTPNYAAGTFTLNAAATAAGNTVACTVTNSAVADLAITKTNSVTSVAAGGSTTYTIRVTNNGPSSVTGAVLNDPAATGLTQTGAACTPASGNICATAPSTTALQSGGGVILPTLASGAFYEFAVTATVTAANGSSVTNIATVAVPSGTTDPSAANNSASDTDSVSAVFSISGQVYVDTNYGGGAGRAYNAGQGMSLRPNVRVELYSAAGGNVLATAFTNASGVYTFSGQPSGTYKVRVVNSFVTSSRTGACAQAINVTTPPASCTQLPVQTYINGASQVGGAFPAGFDPALSTATLPTGAESVASVTLSSSNVSGVDFGFNFSTVVNTNDSGQGSLRQFITNANALDNSSLIQSGNRGAAVTGASSALPAARDTSIFMIPAGSLTSGVAIISPTSVLPAITRANVSIDGTTQTINIGDNNAGTLGTGGTVGYITTATLDTVQKPEVQIVGTTALALGLDVQANNVQMRGLSIYGFGNGANNDSNANIRIGNDFTGTLIEANIIGSPASSFTCGVSTTIALSKADNIRSVGGDNGTVQNNLIGCASGKGFGVEGSSVGWTITNNEISGNGIGNTNLDGIDLENSGSKNHIVRGNLISGNSGVGVDGYQGGGGNLIERNTITRNGTGQGGAPGETPGVRLYSSNNTVKNNVIALNYGAGVMVTDTSTGNLISQNSIYDNGTILAANGAAASGQIGIDLSASGESVQVGNAPYVTKNDSGDADTGGNHLLNFPVFKTAQIIGGNLVLTGYARAGSTIELFIAAADASGFGEGKTYLTTLTEGSAADTDSGTGTYTDANSGTDTTSLFKFSIALPAGVSTGTNLTATATCSTSTCAGTTVTTVNETSEFSYNIPVTAVQVPVITLLKLGRNVTTGTTFIDNNGSVLVKPQQTVEYCIVYKNTGGQAPNFKLTDYVPVGMEAQLSAYGTDGNGKALGLKYAAGVTLAVGNANSAAVTTNLTSISDTDVGTLSSALVTNPSEPVGSPQHPGLMTLDLGPAGLAGNSSGTVCFQARVP